MWTSTYRYPETFSKAIALSPALIVHEIAGMKPGEENDKANYYYYHELFGELDKTEQSDANPETLIDALLRENKTFPDLYFCCGTEDFLIENNRDFHKFLISREVKHEYYESPGIHDGRFWGEYIPKAIDWAFKD